MGKIHAMIQKIHAQFTLGAVVCERLLVGGWRVNKNEFKSAEDIQNEEVLRKHT